MSTVCIALCLLSNIMDISTRVNAEVTSAPSANVVAELRSTAVQLEPSLPAVPMESAKPHVRRAAELTATCARFAHSAAKDAKSYTSENMAERTRQSSALELLAAGMPTMHWQQLQPKTPSCADLGVVMARAADLEGDAAEKAFASTLNMPPREDSFVFAARIKVDSAPTDRAAAPMQATSRGRKNAASTGDHANGPPPKKRRGCARQDASLRDSTQLQFAPVAVAAAEVGLPKSVVQRWITDEQVAFIRPQPNNSHRLVDMADLRQLLQQKRQLQAGRVNPTNSSKRVLVYARVTPSEAAGSVKSNGSGPGAVENDRDPTSEVNIHILDQVRQIADALQLEPGKYMYNGDVAVASDWDNRPMFDLLLDKIIARDIHTIIVATPDHLVRGTAYSLLQRLCQRNGIRIQCAVDASNALSQSASDSDAMHN